MFLVSEPKGGTGGGKGWLLLTLARLVNLLNLNLIVINFHTLLFNPGGV